MKCILYIILITSLLPDNLRANETRSSANSKISLLLFNQLYDGGSWPLKESLCSTPAESNDFNFEIGIRDELYLMFANIYDRNSSSTANTIEAGFIPINFHLTAGLKYRENCKIYLTYGNMQIYEDFGGFDGGIFFQANLLESDFYGILGIDFFNKSGSSHGLSTSNEKNFTFYCFGLGYTLSKHFNIDVSYYIPNDKKFGYDADPDTHKYHDKTINGILKLGFGYLFSF